jgi:uncharacterized protein (DUF488 family)
MKLYTIGFTQKNAETFFGLILRNGIQNLVDIRLKPGGQLSGFAKQEDLPYFLARLAGGCQYTHLPELAPTKEILEDYRTGLVWAEYEQRFLALMDERRIPEILNKADFQNRVSCLLCSEATPEHCHRRLVAERIAAHWPGVEIIHLE